MDIVPCAKCQKNMEEKIVLLKKLADHFKIEYDEESEDARWILKVGKKFGYKRFYIIDKLNVEAESFDDFRIMLRNRSVYKSCCNTIPMLYEKDDFVVNYKISEICHAIGMLLNVKENTAAEVCKALGCTVGCLRYHIRLGNDNFKKFFMKNDKIKKLGVEYDNLVDMLRNLGKNDNSESFKEFYENNEPNYKSNKTE